MAPQIVTIADSATGATAQVLVSGGFNCFSFRPTIDGTPHEALWSHPDFSAGTERASRSGIPILFPFAGRIEGTSFTFDGRSFPLEPGDAAGNAIHGFVMTRPWRVVEQSPSRVVGEFQSATDDPVLLLRWPVEFRIRVSYEVTGNALVSQLVVDNPATKPLPFWLGTHAYFRLPLGGAGDAADTIFSVPAARMWELVDLRPTGKQFGVEGYPNLAQGIRLGDREFDNAFTDLAFQAGQCRTTIHNPANGLTLTQTFDDAFRHLVVYTPPHREAICIEPYTAIPDAFRLESSGVRTGMRILAPGERFSTQIAIDVA